MKSTHKDILKHIEFYKKALSELKGFLPNDVFRGANIFVERALNPEIQKAKYIYPIYQALKRTVEENSFTGKGKKLHYILSSCISSLPSTPKHIFSSILSSQEHRIIGSTPPFLPNADVYTPVGYYIDLEDFHPEQIRLFRTNFFITFTFIKYFDSKNYSLGEYYFLLEELNEKNQTKRDPRLIDFERLLTLLENNPVAFENASLDDIYNECKVEFQYSERFRLPFLRS
ncbi:MAG: hypothetical protein NC935_08145 [Candidatus Omnitrophica bacterium]|nr:hypothetical protein [Candidatus Omnitrophota bacterium]